jgi:Asx homology domain
VASLPNIPLQRLQGSSAFQTDVRQFQEDLRAGKLEPAWIEMAMNASARRRAGEFDGWKERERDMVWGIGGERVAEDGGMDVDGGD